MNVCNRHPQFWGAATLGAQWPFRASAPHEPQDSPVHIFAHSTTRLSLFFAECVSFDPGAPGALNENTAPPTLHPLRFPSVSSCIQGPLERYCGPHSSSTPFSAGFRVPACVGNGTRSLTRWTHHWSQREDELNWTRRQEKTGWRGAKFRGFQSSTEICCDGCSCRFPRQRCTSKSTCWRSAGDTVLVCVRQSQSSFFSLLLSALIKRGSCEQHSL